MDSWLCGDCKSLNTPRAKSCYRCQVPRRSGEHNQEAAAAAVMPGGFVGSATASSPSADTDLDGRAAGASPAGTPHPGLADAPSSRRRSRVLLILLRLTTIWSALSAAMLISPGGTVGLVADVLTGDMAAIESVLVMGGIGALLIAVTAVAWFLWFDRLLRNVPALTGRRPRTGRIGAVGWWFVPVVGLVKAPRVVRDVYLKLRVQGTPGPWLVTLWALAFIGGTVAPWVTIRMTGFLPLGSDGQVVVWGLIALLGQALYVAAGMLAVALVLAMEHAAESQAATGGATSVRVTEPAAGVLEVDPLTVTPAHGPARLEPLGMEAPAGTVADEAPTPGSATADDEPVLKPVARPPARVPAAGAHRAARGFGVPDPFGSGVRRDAVPWRPMAVLGLTVGLAVLGGALLARPGQPDLRRDSGTVLAGSLPTPDPTPTQPARIPVIVTPLRPTPAPTPPSAWTAVAEDLATSTFSEAWTGRMELDATLKIGNQPAIAWNLSVARDGLTEWSRSRVRDAATGVTSTTEVVLLRRIVWTRTTGFDWAKRERGFGDLPTEALFGVRSARDLEFVRSFREDGRTRYRFAMPGASDLLALAFLRDHGAGALDRTSATVVADGDGRPVRADLTYEGQTRSGRARLTVRVRYRDVGGDFSIGSPRSGNPVVD